MNTELPETSLVPSLLPMRTSRHRRGKVARLPKAVRDRLNLMLLDGLSYASIIEKLGPDGNGINEDNIGEWKSGGYQDWLRDQQRVEALKSRQDFAFDLVCEKDGSQLHQATLQIAATSLCELLVDLDPVALREILQEEPDKYTRLLNAIARLSDGHIKHERQRAHEAERTAELAKEKCPPAKGGISDESFRRAEERLNLM